MSCAHRPLTDTHSTSFHAKTRRRSSRLVKTEKNFPLNYNTNGNANLTQQPHFIVGEAKLALQRYQCSIILVMDEFRFILYFLAGRSGVANCVGGGYWGGGHIDAFMSGGHIDAFMEGDIAMHSQLTSF